MKTFLIVNPRSGAAAPTAEELRDAAAGLAVDVHFLEEGAGRSPPSRGSSGASTLAESASDSS